MTHLTLPTKVHILALVAQSVWSIDTFDSVTFFKTEFCKIHYFCSSNYEISIESKIFYELRWGKLFFYEDQTLSVWDSKTEIKACIDQGLSLFQKELEVQSNEQINNG